MAENRRLTRLYVPLDADTLDAITALAEAKNMPRSRIAGEILDETAPIIRKMAEALKKAKTAPAAAIREIQEALEEELAHVDQHELDLETKPKKTG